MTRIVLTILLFMATTAHSAGKWRVNTDISPMDDTPDIMLSLPAEHPVRTTGGQRTPTLIIRCQGKQLSAFLNFDVFLGTGTKEVLYRVDKEHAQTATWIISTNFQAVFVAMPSLPTLDAFARLFMYQLMGHKPLHLERPYGINNNFWEGSRVRLVFAPNSAKMAHVFARETGEATGTKTRHSHQEGAFLRPGTVSTETAPEPLLSPTALQQLRADEVLLLVGNMPPVVLQQARYFE